MPGSQNCSVCKRGLTGHTTPTRVKRQKRSRDRNWKVANLQMARTVGVVWPVNPLLHTFETVTRGSQIKTLAIEPNCWDRSTFLNKHQIPSSSLKGCFSGNPGKSPDCHAFINSRFTFNTRDHLTGAKTLYCFPYDLCFIMIILFYPQSAFYPWSAVCSLHFTLSLHFTPGLQSAVCVLH